MDRATAAELFQRNVTRIMARQRKSQKDLAGRIGGQSHVNKLVNGKYPPKLSDIDELCYLLQVSPAEFFAQDGDTVTPLTAPENRLVQTYRAMSKDERAALVTVLDWRAPLPTQPTPAQARKSDAERALIRDFGLTRVQDRPAILGLIRDSKALAEQERRQSGAPPSGAAAGPSAPTGPTSKRAGRQ